MQLCPYCNSNVETSQFICPSCRGNIAIGSYQAIRQALTINSSFASQDPNTFVALKELVESIDASMMSSEAKRIEAEYQRRIEDEDLRKQQIHQKFEEKARLQEADENRKRERKEHLNSLPLLKRIRTQLGGYFYITLVVVAIPLLVLVILHIQNINASNQAEKTKIESLSISSKAIADLNIQFCSTFKRTFASSEMTSVLASDQTSWGELISRTDAAKYWELVQPIHYIFANYEKEKLNNMKFGGNASSVPIEIYQKYNQDFERYFTPDSNQIAEISDACG